MSSVGRSNVRAIRRAPQKPPFQELGKDAAARADVGRPQARGLIFRQNQARHFAVLILDSLKEHRGW